jgi:hypothetical protein
LVRFPAGVGEFSPSVQTNTETHSASHVVSAVIFLWLKRLVREANHLLSLVPRFKNGTINTSFLHYAYRVWCFIQHRENYLALSNLQIQPIVSSELLST